MKKKIFNVLVVTFFIINIMSMIFPVSYSNAAFSSDPHVLLEERKGDTYNPGVKEGRETAEGIVANVIVAMQIAGAAIAVGMGIVLGMKYMLGSIDDKAQIKKHATLYVIGVIVFFAAFGIIDIIQAFIKDSLK